MNLKSILITVMVLMLISGCNSTNSSDRNINPTPLAVQLNEHKVLDIAKRSVMLNDTWADRGIYKAKRKDNGTWSVMVWRIEGYDDNGKPLFTPGGHRLILINSTGKVTQYIRGK